jgi:hypothetical protein
MWALIVLICITFIDLGIYLAKHGQPRTDKFNFWLYLFCAAIQWWLLYEAGLFDKYIK